MKKNNEIDTELYNRAEKVAQIVVENHMDTNDLMEYVYDDLVEKMIENEELLQLNEEDYLHD